MVNSAARHWDFHNRSKVTHGDGELPPRVKEGNRVALLAAAAGFSAGVVGMVW